MPAADQAASEWPWLQTALASLPACCELDADGRHAFAAPSGRPQRLLASQARYLTYRDVEQWLLSLQADSDVVAFGEPRVLCVDPSVHDHHRQAPVLAVQVPDPVIQ